MSRYCPICKSVKKEFVSKLCANMAVMGEEFPAIESSNVVCKDCGCVYVDIEAKQALFTNYYNSQASIGIEYYKLFGVRQTKDYYRHIYESIKEYINFESNILDCGCGMGDFCVYLKDLGYKNVLGTDPSSRSIDNAKEKGVECIVADAFSKNQSFSEKFDLIIFSHVVEHILDSDIAIENIKTMLKPGGVIYMEVPDAKKYCDVKCTPYFFFTYEHLTHYTMNSFENMAGAFGLELLNSEVYLKCESYYVAYGIFKKGGQYKPVKYYPDTLKAIKRYIEFCSEDLKEFIAPLAYSQEPLALWGIGASTAQLLSGTFDNCKVVNLIDNNPKRQGLKFLISNMELFTQPPSTLEDHSVTIVILSAMYKESIIKQIRSLGFQNKVVALKS